MKTAAQQSRPRNKPPRSNGRGRVQTKIRPGAGNRHRADALEREADALANRVVHGERYVAHHVVTTRAADYRPTGSSGRELSRPVREMFEEAFGADLKEVRIHTGTAADLAACEYGAEAFASGRNIYFRRGRYAPNSEAGRFLLAHELVHVLQQTGRTGLDGRLGATTLTGAGLVQCDDTPTTPPPLSENEQKQIFLTLADRYKKRSTATDLQETIDDASNLLGGRLDPNKPDFAKPFRDAVQTRKFNSKSGDAQGFIVDCLKTMRFFNDAYWLLDTDVKLQIRVGISDLEFLKFLNEPARGDKWSGEALREKEISSFWPSVIVSGYRDFLLRPHSPPPGENAKLRDRTQTEIDRRDSINTSTELVPQERVLLAWILLRDIDKRRVEECGEAQSKSGTTTLITATEYRQNVLNNLQVREQKVLDDQAQPAFRRLLAERLTGLVSDIAPMYKDIMSAYTAWQAAFHRFTDADLLKAPADKFPHSPLTSTFLQTLRQVLVAQTQELLMLDKVEGSDPILPAPDVYDQRLGSFRDSLSEKVASGKGKAATTSVFRQLDDALLAAVRAKKPVQETVQALGLLSLVLDRLVQLTLLYDRAADAAMPHFPDQRAAHRIRMARSLSWLARWMQWTDLLDACAPPLRADDIGKARLWLISEWTPEPRQPIDRLRDDFRANLNTPIIHDSPLTVGHLVTWFHLDYNTRLRATLMELVQPEAYATERTKVDVQKINALRQSREEIKEVMGKNAEAERAAEELKIPAAAFDVRIPQRFTVSDWEVAIPPGAKFEWEELIASQDKTKYSLERHKADEFYSVLIFPKSEAQGVFAWMLPSIKPLIAFIRNISRLRSIAGDTDVDDETWLFRLSPEQLSEAEWAEVNERITKRLEKSNEDIEKDLPDLWLRFNILRRRILVMLLRPPLAAFNQSNKVTGPTVVEVETISGTKRIDTGTRISAPRDTANAIIQFDASVVPPELAPVQTTLFLLQLADLLENVVTEADPQPDFGRKIYPYLLTALDLLDGDAKKLKQLREGTNSFDEAGRIVYIDSDLRAATTQLQNLKKAIDNSYKAAQESVGFASENGKTIVPLGFSTEIYPSHRPGDEHEWSVGNTVDEHGQIDLASGTRYRLIQVYRKFTYHPTIGSLNGKGPGVGPRYIDEDGVEYPRINEAGVSEPIPHIPIFRFEIDGTPKEVFADDHVFLKAMYEVFLWRSFQIQMENLAFLSEEYMKWVMAVVGTLIPGVTYAELATTVMQFILSGELEEIVKQLRNDPAEVLKRLLERLRDEYFTPENVWRYVLLGGQHSPFEALRDIVPSRARQRTTVQPNSKLGRIIFRLRQIGRWISDQLHRLRLYADPPIRSVQGFISMRPTLAWLLRRAAHLIEAAIDLIPPEVIDAVTGDKPKEQKESLTREELTGAVSEGIQDTTADMQVSVVRLLETIHHFELPYELLDLGAATEIILGFIADRFGPRARLIRMVLQIIPIPQEHEGRFTGMKTLYQAICGEIAKVWRDTPIDPNVYWREDVIPVVKTKFTETRDDLVDGLYKAVDTFLELIGQPHLQRPSELPETEVEAVQEAEASFSNELPISSNSPWRLQTSGGRPLPGSLRRSFEGTFGEQFSHVRLHQGAEARAATQPIGAVAVTSGSHVFLAPSQTLAGSTGKSLLGHELTHVVQQTGSHPLGGPPPEVSGGRPNRGLLLDKFREGHADSAAKSVASGRPVSPIKGGTFSGGPQPALPERIVNSVIDTITVARKSSEFTETPHGGSAANVPGVDLARQLWARTVECIPVAQFAGFLKTPDGLPSIPGVSNPNVQELIKNHLKESHEEKIGSKIPDIAQLAQRPRKNRKPEEPETELNAARFVNLLEDFISVERGIALEITFNATDNTISGVKVNNVLLQNIGGTSGLWRIAMYASFSGHSADIPDLSAAQADIRQRLKALPPTPLLYSFSSFQFSSMFVNDYLDLVRSRGRTVEDIEPVKQYTEPRNKRADGLAVSTHGDLIGRGIGTFKRESHHTTQYLLVEFFGNLDEATRKAFPAHHAAYPSGIEFKSGSSGEVKAIRSGGRRLDIEGLNPTSGRGNNMPAILLSARTHQRGELHVLREARWVPGEKYETERKGTATQSFAIENVFNRTLPPELRPHGDSEEHRKAFSKAILDDERANRELYEAAKATYHWMYNRMVPALKSGLQTEELAYYRGVAAIKHRKSADSDELQPGFDMQASDLTPVWDAAKINNDKVMSGFGWPTP